MTKDTEGLSAKSREVATEAEENLQTIRDTVKIIARIIAHAKYMNDEPNDNTVYQRALSIQTMSALNFLFLLMKKEQKTDIETLISNAMFLRALIEVTANIHYFSLHKDDDKLAAKFLKTADSTGEALNNLRKKNKITRYKWTNESISKRISRLESKSNSTSYTDLYFYLSSYVHADAGYLSSLPYAKGKYFKKLFLANTVICLIDLMDALDEAGVLENSGGTFLRELKEYLDNKK